MADLFARCRSWQDYRRALAAGDYTYYLPTAERRGATAVLADGREVVMAGSTDYLGLAADPRVREAAARATADHGPGLGGSRLLCGSLALHEELEARLAAFTGQEAAITAPTGYQAGLALTGLLDAGDTVYADKLDHACLIEAVRTSPATLRRYRHGDTDGLAAALERGPSRDSDGAPVLLTDGLFSMTGDLGDLAGLADLRDRHGARLIVDTSHDVGLLGEHGRGAPEYLQVEDRVDLLVFSFSKSFGGVGGAVAGPADVIDYVRHRSDAILFSAALPPSATAGALAALDVMAEEPWRRTRAVESARVLRDGLLERGLAAQGGPGALLTVAMPDERTCRRYFLDLLDEGVFTSAITPPAIPQGAVLRVCTNAAFTDDHLARILDAFSAVERRRGRGGDVPAAEFATASRAAT
jgi:7-keto-8-aminopelargonate synthetase-like enzyme